MEMFKVFYVIGIILWIVLCVIIESTWRKKGLASGVGFAISFFFSPFVGILMGIVESQPNYKVKHNEVAEKKKVNTVNDNTSGNNDEHNHKSGLVFNCPKCASIINVKFLKPGEVCKCKECGTNVKIPDDAQKLT